MADVKIIDIDNEQWNMKDQVARDHINTIESNIDTLTQNVTGLQNDKRNIVAQTFSGDLNTFNVSNLKQGTDLWVNCSLSCTNKPSFENVGESGSAFMLHVFNAGRWLIQEVYYCYYVSNVAWRTTMYRRKMIDLTWFPWHKAFEEYN